MTENSTMSMEGASHYTIILVVISVIGFHRPPSAGHCHCGESFITLSHGCHHGRHHSCYDRYHHHHHHHHPPHHHHHHTTTTTAINDDNNNDNTTINIIFSIFIIHLHHYQAAAAAMMCVCVCVSVCVCARENKLKNCRIVSLAARTEEVQGH